MRKVYCLQYVGGKCLIGHTESYKSGDHEIELQHACFVTMAEMQDRSRSLMFSFVKSATRNQDVVVNIAGNNTLLTQPYEADDIVSKVYLDFVDSGMFDDATECITHECGPIEVQEEKCHGVLRIVKNEDKVH